MESEVYIPPVQPQLTLNFKSKTEAKELYDELRKWTPSGGWNGTAQQFFEALEEVFNVQRFH